MFFPLSGYLRLCQNNSQQLVHALKIDSGISKKMTNDMSIQYLASKKDSF